MFKLFFLSAVVSFLSKLSAALNRAFMMRLGRHLAAARA